MQNNVWDEINDFCKRYHINVNAEVGVNVPLGSGNGGSGTSGGGTSTGGNNNDNSGGVKPFIRITITDPYTGNSFSGTINEYVGTIKNLYTDFFQDKNVDNESIQTFITSLENAIYQSNNDPIELALNPENNIREITTENMYLLDCENAVCDWSGKPLYKTHNVEYNTISSIKSTLYLFSKLLYLEAAFSIGINGENKSGLLGEADRLDIAWTIRNRVYANKPRWGGSTYEGVIYAPAQYSAIRDKQWNNFKYNKTEFEKIKQITLKVYFSNRKDDPTYGATSYISGWLDDVPWVPNSTQITPTNSNLFTNIYTLYRRYDKGKLIIKDFLEIENGIQSQYYNGPAFIFFK